MGITGFEWPYKRGKTMKDYSASTGFSDKKVYGRFKITRRPQDAVTLYNIYYTLNSLTHSDSAENVQ